MNTLQWGPELETGIPELDTQHKRIVFLVNHMYETRQSKDLEAVGDVITEMVDYALSHFAFEEALMEDAQYRFLGPHKKVHELFTRKIPEFQARFSAGEDITEELHTMLVRWLYNHICGDDQGYVESIKTFLNKTPEPPSLKVPEMKDNIRILLQEIESERPRGLLARLKAVFFPSAAR